MTSVTIDGYAYSDDGSAARDMRAGGHQTWLLPMLAGTMNRVTDAETAATAAAASASSAASSAANLVGTSTTSLTIGTGSKSLTASTGRQWGVGQYLAIVDSATSANAMFGRVTAWNSGTGALTVDVESTSGSGTIASWNIYVSGKTGATGPTGSTGPSGSSLGYSALSSNTTLGASDNGKMVSCTGTFTLTFAAPATLAANWWSYVANVGSGEVTVSHTSGNVDGRTSYVMYPGEARVFQCDGSTVRSLVMRSYYATFTAGGTYTKPPGYQAHGVKLWGGGSGGAVGTGAPGGGGGGCSEAVIPDALIATTETITIGAGGAGSTTANSTAGGNSSFGAVMVAMGGQANSTGSGGFGFFTSVTSNASAYYPAVSGNDSVYGGGSGAYGATSRTVHGGGGGKKEGGVVCATVFGGTGGDDSDGTAPGGGGSAKASGTAWAGARGECRVWGVA